MGLQLKDITALVATFDESKSLYIASDFHLGSPSFEKSLSRERGIVKWMDEMKVDMGALILLGDVFDYWYEYKYVQPKGYWRFLGKLTELSDAGIPLVFFGGNHDMWYGESLQQQLNAYFFTEPCTFQLFGKSYFVHHGDGLGEGDSGYKWVRWAFVNRTLKRIADQLHPDFLARLAHRWSKTSRKVNQPKDAAFYGENEWLWKFAKSMEEEIHFDYYIFGHRHLALDLPVGNDGSRYINSGEWFSKGNYVRCGKQATSLHTLEPQTN